MISVKETQCSPTVSTCASRRANETLDKSEAIDELMLQIEGTGLINIFHQLLTPGSRILWKGNAETKRPTDAKNSIIDPNITK